MSQESRTPRIHIKRRVKLSSLQNEPSSAHNEPESSETSKKSVDISSLKEKYNIRLPRSYKEQTSAPQTVHFSEELESTIPETVDELKTEKLEKSQENINQMKDEIDFLANINQQFGAENDQLIKNLDRFRKYRIPESISVRSSPGDSGTESEIIPSKRPKGRKLKSKKIAKTNKGKRVFGNDSEEEDTESDDEKNEKDARKKLRRIKAAKELFRKNDPNITDYNKESLLRMLADRAFHSPEMSDTDEEDRSKTVVNVYDLSWRSAELKHLLRNVLDPKSASSTTAQLQRKRNYSDEIQRYDFPPPAKTPNWACNEQEDVVYDTEFVQTEGEDEPSLASTSSSKISAEQ
ncbi:hypothetical protein Glove_256g45 [Diversispora epigaea]|uniref:Uncharacterized protein n=1 Tax=Diversispora epigaea TaxID=1348612 RepID=A0A397IES6_9GLOM|nr:hypothetical protein Glove_256g45 [Diversispora epigaea]